MLPSGNVVIARSKEMLEKLLKEGGKKIKKLPDDKTRDTNIATGGGPASPPRFVLEEFYKDGGLAKKKKNKSKKLKKINFCRNLLSPWFLEKNIYFEPNFGLNFLQNCMVLPHQH